MKLYLEPLFGKSISHKVIELSLVPLNILFFSNSNKQKTLPFSLIIISSFSVFIFQIRIVLSYEPEAICPEDNSINETIFAKCPSNVFIQLNSFFSFLSLLSLFII